MNTATATATATPANLFYITGDEAPMDEGDIVATEFAVCGAVVTVTDIAASGDRSDGDVMTREAARKLWARYSGLEVR